MPVRIATARPIYTGTAAQSHPQRFCEDDIIAFEHLRRA